MGEGNRNSEKKKNCEYIKDLPERRNLPNSQPWQMRKENVL